MCRTSIARHSIPSTFFYTSAVCLLIGQNVNKNLTEIDGNFWMDLFGTKPPRNHFFRVKLLPKVMFLKFFYPKFFNFGGLQNWKEQQNVYFGKNLGYLVGSVWSVWPVWSMMWGPILVKPTDFLKISKLIICNFSFHF